MNGFLIAAPQSGSGKTTVTLGLMRSLKRQGVVTAPAKAGPDYIDPAFHAFASGVDCVNLDPWAMRPELLRSLAADCAALGTLVVEGMMGLFDGAADGSGSAADLAVLLGLPVVLVIDTARQSHSIAALASGFRDHRPDVRIAGVILNRIGSKRHEVMLRAALQGIGMPVLGAMMRDDDLVLPSRHLGLVQAREHEELEFFVERAADAVEQGTDIDALLSLHRVGTNTAAPCENIPPLGQLTAVACDDAFAFIYPHLINNWRGQGAQASLFSPLADEGPTVDCDAVFLPGGYPELHVGRLASNMRFMGELHDAANRGALIYGECGGYMVLGDGLVDSDGIRHKMAGLLRLETSFAARKLQLGYRMIEQQSNLPFGMRGTTFSAHEFHYSTATREEGESLFRAKDALDQDLGLKGLRCGNVAGSYMHLIDKR
ncbi:MAG: cobyrinate a,c-diamide synthase [Rhizobiaceae bacterium]